MMLLQPLQRRGTVGGGQQGKHVRKLDPHPAMRIVERVALDVQLAPLFQRVDMRARHPQQFGSLCDCDVFPLSHDHIIAHSEHWLHYELDAGPQEWYTLATAWTLTTGKGEVGGRRW